MPIDTTNAVVWRKSWGGKPAKEEHGVQGWWEGELVTYYEHLGWFTGAECVAFAEAERKSGAVFASRYCYVPAAEVEGNWGWAWYGSGKPRVRVRLTDGQWIFIQRSSS